MSFSGFIDDEIARRSRMGKKCASLLENVPKGLSWVDFIQHPEVEEMGLDFITCSEMYSAYTGKEET